MPYVEEILIVLLQLFGAFLAIMLLACGVWWWHVRAIDRLRSSLSAAAAKRGWQVHAASLPLSTLPIARFEILRRSVTAVDLFGPEAKANPCASINTPRETGYVFHVDGAPCYAAIRLNGEAPHMSLRIRSWLLDKPDKLPDIAIPPPDPFSADWCAAGSDAALVRKILTHDVHRVLTEDPHVMMILTMESWLLVAPLPPESPEDYLRLWDTTAKLGRHISRSLPPSQTTEVDTKHLNETLD